MHATCSTKLTWHHIIIIMKLIGFRKFVGLGVRYDLILKSGVSVMEECVFLFELGMTVVL